MPKRFTRPVAAALDETTYLYIRSGADHRFIAVWPVVVKGRLFARSWNDKPTGWRRAFVEDPNGEIRLGDRVIRVRTRRVTGERLNAAIDEAYRAKYNSKSNLKWTRGLTRGKRRETTTEFIPR